MRLLFIGESGVDVISSLGEDLSRAEAISQAKGYLMTQWVDDRPEFYQEIYDDGMRRLDEFAVNLPESPDWTKGVPPTQALERFVCVISVEYGYLMICA